MFAFRDRVNIGEYYLLLDMCPQLICQPLANAKVAGMSTDLNLVGLRYNTAAAVFFVRIYVDI